MVTVQPHRPGTGLRPVGIGRNHSNPGRLGLWVLASVLMAGCSNSKPVPPVERDPCLDAGPAKSVAYDKCAADRKAAQSEALKALLDDTGAYSQGREIALSDSTTLQESDFPDSPSPMRYSGADSVSAAEKRALPFKVRITWKYSSKELLPTPQDGLRMDQMEKLILPAVQDKGLAKWACTVTGGQQREWIFYARDDEAFIVRTKAVLAQSGPYPVELSSRKEPASSVNTHNDGNSSEYIRITPKSCLE